MQLFARPPLPAERRRRIRRLGFTRYIAPIARISGRRWLRAWVKWHIAHPAAVPAGFHVPLVWVEAAFGQLPTRTLAADQVATILADWVDCGSVIRNTTDYYLGSGDWAALIRSTDGDPVREEARQLYAAGLDYSRTEFFHALLEASERGEPQRRQGRELMTREDVQAYLHRFVRLFQSIESHGLLPNHALDAAGVRFNSDRGLGLAMDADGRLHRLQGGNHRWAIAQVLGLRHVPAEIRLHHVRSAMLLEDRA
jgi:hypothetical protein